MKPPICFLSGRYLETEQAVIPALDRGFLFGEGLFETWRTYHGRPFALREHLARMAASARAIGIPFDPGADWEGRTLKLARLNDMTGGGGAVRLTITRGAGPVSLIPGPVRKPTQLMLFRPLEPGLAEARRDGVSVHLLDFGKGVNPSLRRLKTLNYLPAVMGKVAARENRCFESLYVLKDSTVLEGTTSNFFLVKRGRLVTTPVEQGILPGVTRAVTIKLAERFTSVEERRISKKELYDADEMFITSSTIEVVPVLRAGRRRIGKGQIGPVTRELQIRYRRYVARRLGVRVEKLGE
jgi:branched-subunit amino acid aminotransferase/4-amino-4-deoxychorismate lyase